MGAFTDVIPIWRDGTKIGRPLYAGVKVIDDPDFATEFKARSNRFLVWPASLRNRPRSWRLISFPTINRQRRQTRMEFRSGYKCLTCSRTQGEVRQHRPPQPPQEPKPEY